jgi:hypothetical protein
MSQNDAGAENLLTNTVKCPDCGMLFTSNYSLAAHRESFCAGVKTSMNRVNPTLNLSPSYSNKHNTTSTARLTPINKLYTDDRDYLNNNSNRNKPNTLQNNSSLVNLNEKSRHNDGNAQSVYSLNPNKTRSAINELKYYKNKKSMEQSIEDFEDTLVRDTMRDKQLAASLKNVQALRNDSSQNDQGAGDPYKELFKQVD